MNEVSVAETRCRRIQPLGDQALFLGVDSDILSAKALEYSSDITEELRAGFAVYEHIVDVYLADFINKTLFCILR